MNNVCTLSSVIPLYTGLLLLWILILILILILIHKGGVQRKINKLNEVHICLSLCMSVCLRVSLSVCVLKVVDPAAGWRAADLYRKHSESLLHHLHPCTAADRCLQSVHHTHRHRQTHAYTNRCVVFLCRSLENESDRGSWREAEPVWREGQLCLGTEIRMTDVSPPLDLKGAGDSHLQNTEWFMFCTAIRQKGADLYLV